jgi:SRSO17 transposase
MIHRTALSRPPLPARGTRISQAPRPPVSSFDAEREQRFEAFVAGLRPVFQRSDQFLRFRAYVRGLLEAGERKNFESLAAAAGTVMLAEADLAQALQHFVTQSPWSAARLMTAIRTRAVRANDATWVVHDGVFPKKGRHSVGVQRQFARSLGRKINCQVGVFVSAIGPRGEYSPLAARLYLPANWLRDNTELAGRLVPEDHRVPLSKTQIALTLIDELLAERATPGAVTGEAGYLGSEELAVGLAERRLPVPGEGSPILNDACRKFEEMKARLGMDHFEGRNWSGWHHHVALVFAAQAFLGLEPTA